MRVLEAFVFMSLASVIHLGIWHLSLRAAGSAAAGNNGADEMTLQAASASQAAMVTDGQRTPAVSDTAPDSLTIAQHATSAMSSSVPPTAPAPPGPAPRTADVPQPVALPQADTRTAEPPAKQSKPQAIRPKARPAVAASAAQPRKRAAGSGQQARSGDSSNGAAKAQNAANANALKAM